MNSEFDVTVIMPTYNSARFVTAPIESVMAQTGLNVELIVVDDASQDDTVDVLNALKARSNIRFHVEVQPKNQGQATARNLGLDLARGKYVAFLDSDDLLASDTTLRDWVRTADEQNAEVVCAHYSTIRLDGARTPSRPVAVPATGVVTLSEWPALANVSSCWQMLYRRAFLDTAKIRFFTELPQREDRPFVLTALTSADRIAVTEQRVLDHMAREGSVVRTIDDRQLALFTEHCRLVGGMLSRASEAGRIDDRFLRANTIIYCQNLVTYWGKFLTGQDNAASREQIEDLFDALRAFPDFDLPLYLDDTLVPNSVGAEQNTAEAMLDLLWYFIRSADTDRALKIIGHQRLSISELFAIWSEERAATEEIFCRYLTFNRGARFGTEDGADVKLGDLVERVVIHVGPTKTGSSYAQATLERNRFTLIEQGVHYPVTGARRERTIRRERTAGHAAFFDNHIFHDGGLYADLCAEIISLGRPIKTLVMSAENIVSLRFWRQGNIVDLLAEVFGDVPIDFVFVPRDFGPWFASYYRELAANPRNDWTHNPKRFFYDLCVQGLASWDRVEEILARPGNVTCVHRIDYDDMREQGGVLPWFLGIIGVDLNKLHLPPPALRNESLPDVFAAAMLISKAMGRGDRNFNTLVFERLKAQMETLDRSFSLIGDAELGEILAAHDRLLNEGQFPKPDWSTPENGNTRSPEIGALKLPADVWDALLSQMNPAKGLSTFAMPPGLRRLDLPQNFPISINNEWLTRVTGLNTGPVEFRNVYRSLIGPGVGTTAFVRPGADQTFPVQPASPNEVDRRLLFQSHVYRDAPRISVAGTAMFGGDTDEILVHVASRRRTDGAGWFIRFNSKRQMLVFRLYRSFDDYDTSAILLCPCPVGRAFSFRAKAQGRELYLSVEGEDRVCAVQPGEFGWINDTSLFVGANAFRQEEVYLGDWSMLKLDVESFDI
ncbi:MAG: glycosyltransferase family A protein [Pseudomonadota bacterium]|nr:glycosyltransferase family A protein [Pseudomonadota bacterium]